jgi:glycosyltransferase involved in cell wall biosynthesis
MMFVSFFFIALFSLNALFADHLLTFIIPCYNCEKWIGQAIESIYKQENLQCPYEVICTDDGSKDGTYDVLCSLSQIHPEMQVFQHAVNRGGSAARNTCVMHSKGDIIFCLDSDNVLCPNSVQLLIDRMDETGDDVISFGYIQFFIDNFKKTSQYVYDLPGQKYTFKDCLSTTLTPPWSGNYLYTKESFLRAGGYPEKFSTIDTFAFGFHQLLTGSTMSVVPGTYYFHRHGIDSYWMRETRSRRLQTHFLELLLSHEEIFTEATINTIHQCLTAIRNGNRELVPAYFLDRKLLQLK